LGKRTKTVVSLLIESKVSRNYYECEICHEHAIPKDELLDIENTSFTQRGVNTVIALQCSILSGSFDDDFERIAAMWETLPTILSHTPSATILSNFCDDGVLFRRRNCPMPPTYSKCKVRSFFVLNFVFFLRSLCCVLLLNVDLLGSVVYYLNSCSLHG